MRTLVSVVLVLVSSACGGSRSSERPAEGSGAPADLAARGATLYADNCAGCHGNGGEGSDKAPPVVGPEAFPLDPRPGQKRNVQFRTALDVYQWIGANMPPDEPGSLSEAEYQAIMAFDLKANGVDLAGKPVTAETLAGIVLH